MGLVPTTKLAFVTLVTPLTKMLVPKLFVPLKNVTVPVGKPAPGAATPTVTVKAAGWPNTVGLMAEIIPFVVPAWLTVCIRLFVLPRKFSSPE